jgi:hypothetical protein
MYVALISIQNFVHNLHIYSSNKLCTIITIYIILVFYLKKNRLARRHAPFDKKKRGAMYCRCALFHFFKQSNLSLEFSKNCKKKKFDDTNYDTINYIILTATFPMQNCAHMTITKICPL